MILLPPAPCHAALEGQQRRVDDRVSSLPWVVKSRPGSADSGAVPEAIVMVPPVLPPDAADVLALDDELEPPAALELELELELPQAATTNARMTVAMTAANGRVYLFTDPPPQEVEFSWP